MSLSEQVNVEIGHRETLQGTLESDRAQMAILKQENTTLSG